MKIFYVISHTEREENSMAYSYKCSISFGLVYIPVTLHASVKTQDVGFNMLDKKTMSSAAETTEHNLVRYSKRTATPNRHPAHSCKPAAQRLSLFV